MLIWTVRPRTVALVMGAWAPGSKLLLLACQYAVGRASVRRCIVAVLKERRYLLKKGLTQIQPLTAPITLPDSSRSLM